MKRAFDLVASSVGLLVLLPVFCAVAVAVRLSSPGAVLHRAVRVGRYGRRFRLLKFRSMVDGAQSQGPAVTAAGDPRVTRVGAFLRKTKLDELPQLINVIRGEMSLVGPRPEAPKYVAVYSEEQRRILALRPGITSMASVAYRNEESILPSANLDQYYTTVVMPAKITIDLAYAARATVLSDIGVILRTLGVPVSWGQKPQLGPGSLVG